LVVRLVLSKEAMNIYFNDPRLEVVTQSGTRGKKGRREEGQTVRRTREDTSSGRKP
jgi:hypothetical protein